MYQTPNAQSTGADDLVHKIMLGDDCFEIGSGKPPHVSNGSLVAKDTTPLKTTSWSRPPAIRI